MGLTNLVGDPESANGETNVLRGVVRGKTIELDHELGLPDGQQVAITVQPLGKSKRLPPGEGIIRSAGGWADHVEGLDEYLEWNRRQRKVDRRILN